MKCIQCNDAAKLKEHLQPERVFCGRLCQLEYHLIGLGTDDNIVGLEAADGTRIEITIEQAREMKTIEYLLEDAGSKVYIPVPNFTGTTLLKIKEYLETGTIRTIRLSDQEFFALLQAANFLDFEPFLYHLMPKWVNTRPFPGPKELGPYVNDALYFFEGNISLLDQKYQRLFAKKPPIVNACKYGRLGVVKELLNLNVDPSVDDNAPIRSAVWNGYFEIVELLLKDCRVDPAARNNYCVETAAGKGFLRILQLLLKDERVDPAANNNSAIRIAARYGQLDEVELLLKDSRVDPTALDNATIRLAAQEGQLAIINLLLKDKRVDPTTNDNFPISVAAQNGYLSILERLAREPGIDFATKRNQPIFLAAKKGHLKVVEFLLQQPGVDPSANNNAPLRIAAENGFVGIVELLLQDPRVDIEIIRPYPAYETLYNQYRRTKRQRI